MTRLKRPYRGWPTRAARRIPAPILEQPWGVFVMGLCIASGLTTFVGPAPGSITSTLPRWAALVWSATLVLGASAGLLGLLRPAFPRVEIAGLVWLGTASLVYGASVALRFGPAGLVAAGIIVGFGLAAFVRALAVYVSYEVARRVARPEVR